MAKRTKADSVNPVLDALDKIQPEAPPRRFLQAWLPDVAQLTFGCGDGQHGIVVRGDGLLDVSDEVTRSRLTKDVIGAAVPRTAPFEDVRAILGTYVHFDDPRVLDLVALWVLGTYIYAIFSHYGYLFFHSKLPRSGKTRVLEVISHLAFDATSPLNAPTVPTIRDYAADGRTVQLDTLERLRSKNAEVFHSLMEYLDAGFRNGGTVTKKERTGPADSPWETRAYPAYAPYTIAAINKDSLDDTALDRAFTIEMRRKAIATKTRNYRYAACDAECRPIRDALYAWALKTAPQIAAVYASPQLEKSVEAIQLHDRATDIWKPLFAVASVLGLDVTALAQLAREMSGDPDSMADDRRLSILTALLNRARAAGGELIGMTEDVMQWSGADKDVWKALSDWGFKKTTRRYRGEPRKVWILPTARLESLVRELADSVTYYPPEKRDYIDYTGGRRPVSAASNVVAWPRQPLLARIMGTR